MIKIIQAFYVQKKILRLYFSDNSYGDYDLQPLIDKESELVLPLNDEVFFKGFFLELCPDSIYQKSSKNNQLHFEIKVA